MRRRRLASAVFGGALLIAGCRLYSSPHIDCTEFQAVSCSADETPDGGGIETGSDVVAPPDCDLAKSPKDSAPCLDDSVAVFVSPSGEDGATGEKNSPVRSIGRGVELAASRGLPRVYVCEGTYDAAVEVTAGVSIYGGFSCSWAFTGAKPKLAPPKGVALRVTKASGAVLVEDLEIVGSADVHVAGDSAIAAFVSESANVTLRQVNLTAGEGTAGAKGGGRSNYTEATATAGGNANGAIAGVGSACTCVDATTSNGGNGAAGSGTGLSDGSASPAVGDSNGGLSGTTTCNDGKPGANGLANGSGAGLSSSGTLSASGWTATANPANAPNGHPGQGGGGGGAKTNANSAGGGGGCGGCGGAGGVSGQNGGSSFALLSFNSFVSIHGGALTTGAAGAGGTGGEGQVGQSGGDVGTGACNGGAGGHGAGGSGGGGGAGGHSAPIGFVGTVPSVNGATLIPGAKGVVGSGGEGGKGPGTPGAKGNDGAEGKSEDVLSL